MTGTWKWNAVAGILGGAVIFLFSYGHNPMQTALYRTGVSFLVCFIMTFPVRWMLSEAMNPMTKSKEQPLGEEDPALKGQRIDMVTPDELESQESQNTAFRPIEPPRLVSTGGLEDPERMAQAIRRISES